jgi:hypothetical protein
MHGEANDESKEHNMSDQYLYGCRLFGTLGDTAAAFIAARARYVAARKRDVAVGSRL